MNAQQLWRLFLETGSPEIYLLYKKCLGSAVSASA